MANFGAQKSCQVKGVDSQKWVFARPVFGGFAVLSRIWEYTCTFSNKRFGLAQSAAAANSEDGRRGSFADPHALTRRRKKRYCEGNTHRYAVALFATACSRASPGHFWQKCPCARKNIEKVVRKVKTWKIFQIQPRVSQFLVTNSETVNLETLIVKTRKIPKTGLLSAVSEGTFQTLSIWSQFWSFSGFLKLLQRLQIGCLELLGPGQNLPKFGLQVPQVDGISEKFLKIFMAATALKTAHREPLLLLLRHPCHPNDPRSVHLVIQIL